MPIESCVDPALMAPHANPDHELTGAVSRVRNVPVRAPLNAGPDTCSKSFKDEGSKDGFGVSNNSHQ